MSHIQQGREGVKARAVLHLTRDMLGEIGFSTTATIRTEVHFSLVLSDVEAQFWQVVNLPSKAVRDLYLLPTRSTRTRSREGYRLDFVGLVTEFQRFPWVSLLPTRRAFTLLTLTFGFPG